MLHPTRPAASLHREGSAAPAREVWQTVPNSIARTMLLQLLITVRWGVGSDHGWLTPAQTVALVRQLVVAGTAVWPVSEPGSWAHVVAEGRDRPAR